MVVYRLFSPCVPLMAVHLFGLLQGACGSGLREESGEVEKEMKKEERVLELN